MEALNVENAWIVAVTGARRRLPGWLGVLLAIAALALGLLLGSRIIAGMDASDVGRLSPVAAEALEYLGVMSPLYACAFLFLLVEGRQVRHPALGGARGWALGGAVGGLLFLMAVLAAAMTGVLTQGRAGAPAGSFPGILAAGLLVAFQVFGEELFFRGWLQPLLAADFGIPVGLALTAALFAAAHCVLDSPSAVAILNIFLAGLLFGLIAFRTGSLMAPFACHWVWNWVEQSVFGLSPNPGVDALGALVDLDLFGPTFLGGGKDGLNGSLAVTVLLFAGSAAFVLAAFDKAPRASSSQTRATLENSGRLRR